MGNKDITIPHVIANGQYTIEKEIGKGSFAIVYRGHLTNNINSHIAIKVVSKNKLKNKKLLENLEIEIAILKKIKHNHIVSLIDCERTQTDFYLIMEYCALGDLTFLIKKRKELIQKHPLLQEIFEFYPPPNESHNGLNQAFILNYLQQLSSALKFLRDKNLVHRDIKPQNLLLSTPLINYSTPKKFHDLGYVGIYNLPILKIADFGFARFLPNSSMAETLCGSPLYMAPEILNYQKYNAKADLWSVGTVLYEMCCGHPPFKASNHLELFKKIKRSNNNITFPTYFDNFNSQSMNSQLIKIDEFEFHEINNDLKILINQLLTFDPRERLSFQEFFNNKLINMDLSKFEIVSNNIIETKSKDIQESNMFISEYLTTPKQKQQQQSSQQLHETPTKRISSKHNTVNNSDLILEKEYVVVEKKSVEVNELADEVAQMGNKDIIIPTNNGPHSTNRSPSNNSNSSRRASLIERRLSINSLNPTNALSRALGIASIKLFGGTSPQQQQSQLTKRPNSIIPNSIFNNQTFNDLTEKIILRINNDDPTTITSLQDKKTIQKLTSTEIVHILEIQAAKAFVIYSYAEVKYAQIIPFLSSHTTKRLSTGSCAIEDEDEDDQHEEEEQKQSPHKITDMELILYKEAITLYLKSLEILSKSMKMTSLWWFNQVNQHTNNSNNSNSLRLNLLVQWIRERFNECLTKAEYIKIKLVENDLNDHTEDIFLEKLLYDRALDISKNAAKMELIGTNLNSCELSYATALWILEIIIDNENEQDEPEQGQLRIGTESSLAEDDKKVIKKYIESISGRLKALRTKLNINTITPVEKHLI